MLTVVAIDESLMHEIGEFEPLLRSVAREGEYKICGWKRDEVTLQKAVPALFDREFITEGELLEWNILVIADNRKCFAHNPFEGDYVRESTKGIHDMQLNELAKMLGVIPVNVAYSDKEIDKDTGRITWGMTVDRSLRDEKLSQYLIENFTRPQRIYLLSVQKEEDVDIDHFKSENGIHIAEHAHFSTDGLYPPNCRFFKFNLSTVSNKVTAGDYFRLWMTVMTLAYNDDADDFYFAADTLYHVDADIDEEMVAAQVNEIYSRVHGIKHNLESRIAYIHNMREFNQSKRYALPQFVSAIRVEYETDEGGLYLDEKKFGLTKNCPVNNDETSYASQRESIEKRIKDYLKAPQRALRCAVRQTKQEGIYQHKTDEFIYLSREQREDLQEELDATELELMDTADVDINYPKENALLRKAADKRTKAVMKRRSNKGAVIGGSLVFFLAFFISFLPYVFGKTVETRVAESYIQAAGVSLACVALLGITGFITLLILKRPLKSALYHFKKVIDALVAFVKKQASVYSAYLSKLCVFMQMNSFKRHVDSNVSAYMRDEENTLVLNRNYCTIVEQLCEQWADNLNFKLKYNDKLKTVLFDLDNKPEQNSIFSFVVSNGETRIRYNQKPSGLSSPYPFIESLNISSVEVYE